VLTFLLHYFIQEKRKINQQNSFIQEVINCELTIASNNILCKDNKSVNIIVISVNLMY